MSSSNSNASARRRRAGVPNSGNEQPRSAMTPVSLLQQHNFRLSKIEQTIERLMGSKLELEDDESPGNSVAPQEKDLRNNVPSNVPVPPPVNSQKNYTYNPNLEDIQLSVKEGITDRLKTNNQENVSEINKNEVIEIVNKKITELEEKFKSQLNDTIKEKLNSEFSIKLNTLEGKINDLIETNQKNKESAIELDVFKKDVPELKQNFTAQNKLLLSQQESINKTHQMLVEYLEIKNKYDLDKLDMQAAQQAQDSRNSKMMEMMQMLQNKSSTN
jgi:hypothetical protein